MCLPEYASKRKKYSSTASGPPPLMQRRSSKTEEERHANNWAHTPVRPYGIFCSFVFFIT